MTSAVEPQGEHVVVVLNFHGREDTVSCVESLVEGAPEALVLVVDNGSHDGTLAAVQDRWPHVHRLQNPVNLGFAGGMNSGLRWALERGASTVTVLNNDTVLPAGALSALEATAGSARAVSPEVRYLDDPQQVWFAGGRVDEDSGLARHLSAGELSASPASAEGLRPSQTLAGCCVTAAAETWCRVGLFDERYFLNFEDSDWSLRARAVGIDLVVDTHVLIQHRVSASFTGAYSYLGLFYYTRNGLLFIHDRAGGSVARAARFLRRHVIPDPVRRARRGERRDASRRALVIAVAVGCRLRGRYGRAPAWLERRATRWSA